MNSGPEDLQTNTGETLQDTADVLSGYLDALVLRTADEARNKIHGNDLYA